METNKKKIEHLLIDMGMTKNELAKNLGITRQALWLRLNGSIKNIGLIEEVADQLGVPAKDLLI